MKLRSNRTKPKAKLVTSTKSSTTSDEGLQHLERMLALGTMTAFDPDLARELYKGSGPKRPERVVVEIDAARSEEARRFVWGDSQTIQSRRGGGTRVSFISGDFAPVIARVLRLGSHARVIKPSTLIAAVVENLTATAALYAQAHKRKRRA